MVNNSLISNGDVGQAVSMIDPVILSIVNAIVILLIGFVIGKIVQRLSLRLFDMIELDKLVRKRLKIKRLSSVLANVLAFAVYFIAIIIALNRLDLATPLFNTIIILLVIVILLFVLFGLNDIFANYFAGILFRMRKNVSVGDRVRIKNHKNTVQGKVERITLLQMQIDTGKEEIVIMPNTLLARSVITKVRKKK